MAAAEETAEKSAPAPADAAPSGGGGNKLMVILTIVNMVATIGMVAVLFISFKKDQKARVGDIVAHEEHAEGEKAEGGKEAAGGEGGHGEAKKEPDAKRAGKEFGKMISLEQFTVNLATAGSVNPKFARVAISLELPSNDVEGEVGQKMAQVRNTIIDLFNSKKPSDLSSVDGRNYLREEIRNALNSFLVTGKVKGVFFTNFALSG